MIGIGAGDATDGQVLVFHDLLGIQDGHAARFVKRYADVGADMIAGVARYAGEVRRHVFPAPSTSTRSTTPSFGRFREDLAGGTVDFRGRMGRFANDLAPQDRVYFELFEEAGRNMTSAAGMLHELLAGLAGQRAARR